MTPSQEKYLQLLRCGLWDRQSDQEVDPEVFAIAKEQSTTALICKDSRIERYQDELMNVLWSHSRLNAVIAEISGILDARGIPSVLLKGQGCASFYPNPELRNCGDIDLYVGPENYADAVAAIAVPGSPVEECDIHAHLTYKKVTVEIHRACINTYWMRRKKTLAQIEKQGLSKNLQTIEIGGATINIPEVNFNAVYILYHLTHHLAYAGIGFRQICDWTMLLHSQKDKLDRGALSSMLEKVHMMNTWQLIGYIAVNTLGLPKEEMPFYSDSPAPRAAAVVERIFSCGNFGRAADDSVQRKIRSRKTFIGRKATAMFSYIGDYFEKRKMIPDFMPLTALFSMLWTGIRSSLNSKQS